MKKKKERKKWKGLKMGNLFVGFVALLMTCLQTVHAEEINWQKPSINIDYCIEHVDGLLTVIQ